MEWNPRGKGFFIVQRLRLSFNRKEKVKSATSFSKLQTTVEFWPTEGQSWTLHNKVVITLQSTEGNNEQGSILLHTLELTYEDSNNVVSKSVIHRAINLGFEKCHGTTLYIIPVATPGALHSGP